MDEDDADTVTMSNEIITLTAKDVTLRPFDPQAALEELEAGRYTVLLALTNDDKVVGYYPLSREPKSGDETFAPVFSIVYRRCCCGSKRGSFIGFCCCGNLPC